MFLKKSLIILLLLSFTIIHADIIEVKSYKITNEKNIQTKKEDKQLKTGVALDIKVKPSSNFNYTLAYEGDYMFMNNYLKEERQIKKNNYYIGIGYRF